MPELIRDNSMPGFVAAFPTAEWDDLSGMDLIDDPGFGR